MNFTLTINGSTAAELADVLSRLSAVSLDVTDADTERGSEPLESDSAEPKVSTPEPPAAPETPAPVATEPEPAPAPVEPKATYSDIQAKARAMIQSGERAVVQSCLRKYNAGRLGELTPDKYDAFMADLCK